MRASRAHRRRAQRNVLWAVALGVLSLAAVGAAALYVAFQDPPLDPQTLCPAQGPAGHVVLLVDTTDPFTFTQQKAFQVFLEDFGRGKVKQGELLSVFVLGEDFRATAEPVFNMCNPGRGDDRNRWTSNPEKYRKVFEERFVAPMLALSDTLLKQPRANASPIFEMIQMTAITGFRRHRVQGPRRLVVVSDLLHNTPQYSQYSGDTSFERLAGTAYFQKVRTDLEGAEVEVFYLVNAPKLQGRPHVKFWEDYFQAINGRLTAVKRVEG